MITLTRLRNEARDFLELVLVPGIAAFLPWPFCFRVFRWLCRFDFIYRDECRQALAYATERGWVGPDPAAWLQQCRLVTLVDNADFYLSCTRSNRWMDKHLLVDGHWPAPDKAALVCTFHWGAGMWALRHLRYQGMNTHGLIAPHSRANFPGRMVRYYYYTARNIENEAAIGNKAIPASSPRQVMRALAANQQVLAAVDVPADQAAASEPVKVIGFHARVPRALFRISTESHVPMFIFLTGIRMSDGKRTLKIRALSTDADIPALAAEAFVLLEQAISESPPAWHFWKVAPRFFCDPPPP